MLAVAVLAVVLVSACTRSSGSKATSASPIQIYTAGPTVQQIRTSLGNDMWWPGAPSFRVRPLDLESTPEDLRFSINQHYVHVGTPETFDVEYLMFTTNSAASTRMTNLQTRFGSNAQTSPKVGDQVIYYGEKLATSTALYDTLAFVRLGPMIMTIDLKQTSGFAEVNRLASIGKSLVSRVQDVLANKVQPSPLPSTDDSLLPPPGSDITLLGAARIPIQASADIFHAAAPEAFVSTFTDQGVQDFLYGDYALDADFHMEVKAAIFSFSSGSQASQWLYTVFGANNVGQDGVVAGYSDITKEYYAYFVAGSHIAWLTCASTSLTEAASRACETPLDREIPAWHFTLIKVP